MQSTSFNVIQVKFCFILVIHVVFVFPVETCFLIVSSAIETCLSVMTVLHSGKI